MKRKNRIVASHLGFMGVLYLTFILKEAGIMTSDEKFMGMFIYICCSALVVYLNEEKRCCKECFPSDETE